MQNHTTAGVEKKITITKLPPSCNLVIFVQYVTYLGDNMLWLLHFQPSTTLQFPTTYIRKENSEEKERVNPIRCSWTVELLMDSPLQTDSSDQWWWTASVPLHSVWLIHSPAHWPQTKYVTKYVETQQSCKNHHDRIDTTQSEWTQVTYRQTFM